MDHYRVDFIECVGHKFGSYFQSGDFTATWRWWGVCVSLELWEILGFNQHGDCIVGEAYRFNRE